MKKILLILPVLLLISACKKEGSASVSCNQVEKFQSNLGLINLPKFTHGNIIRLNPKTKTTDQVINLSMTDNDYSPLSTRSDTETVLTNTKFSIVLSGDITKADQSIQAKVKNEISNNTMYYLTQSYRKSMKDALGKLNSDSIAIARIKEFAAVDTNCFFIIVSSIVYADEFKFKVKRETSVDANAHIINIGDFSLSVTYDCEGAINISSKNNGIFFKPTFFRYSLGKDKIEPLGNNDVNLSDYSWINSK